MSQAISALIERAKYLEDGSTFHLRVEGMGKVPIVKESARRASTGADQAGCLAADAAAAAAAALYFGANSRLAA
jgi:hypothetical protein